MSNMYVMYPQLKSVDSNFTLAVHSPKLNQAKTHFLFYHNVYYLIDLLKFIYSGKATKYTNFKFLKRDQWSNG